MQNIKPKINHNKKYTSTRNQFEKYTILFSFNFIYITLHYITFSLNILHCRFSSTMKTIVLFIHPRASPNSSDIIVYSQSGMYEQALNTFNFMRENLNITPWLNR